MENGFNGQFHIQNFDSATANRSDEYVQQERDKFYSHKNVGRVVVLNTKNYSDVYEIVGMDTDVCELRDVGGESSNTIRCSNDEVEYVDNYVDWNTDNLRSNSGEFNIEYPFYTKGVKYLLKRHYKNVIIDCTTPGSCVARYSGKLNESISPMTALRFKIFNEGTKNARKKIPTKSKKSSGSMADIATKLGIKIKESFLTEDALLEDKADKQRFIDKFGQDNFDTFWNNRQRLKNKGINADITWHAKHTSVSDMLKILDSISDEKIAAERDYEGNPLPEPTNNYEVVFKNDEYTVYHPMDYVSSIYCAKGGRWCTAGGYMIPEGQVKVSQAKQYFNQYTSKGVKLYYFIRNNGERYALATYSNSDSYEVYNKADENIGHILNIPNIENMEIDGLDIQYMIDNGGPYCCEECGRGMVEDEVCWGPDSEVYCEDCFNERCFWCYKCGEIFYEEDCVEGPDGLPYCDTCAREQFMKCDYCDNWVEQDSIYHTDEDEYICGECLDKTGYQICDYCGDAITEDDYEKMGDEIYCNSCFTRVTKPCCSCGALDVKYNMVRVNSSDLMCQDCAKLQMQQNESYSKPMRFKVRREL